MSLQTTILTYGNHRLESVLMDGKLWVRVALLLPPLGLSSRALRMVISRHKEEFSEDEARKVVLPTPGGRQEMWVFSLRGAELLALLARTPEGRKFRRWVLDILQGRREKRAVQSELSLPGTHRLPMEAVRALEDVATLIEPEHPARAAIAQMIEGSRPLADDPGLDRLVEQYEGAHKLQGEAQRFFSEIRREAVRMGYTLEAVKRARRQRHGT